jgi:hypothetical protein
MSHAQQLSVSSPCCPGINIKDAATKTKIEHADYNANDSYQHTSKTIKFTMVNVYTA